MSKEKYQSGRPAFREGEAAFREGEAARISGKLIVNSPYLYMSNSDVSWKDGWRKADYELKAAKRRY